jgi:hypothetical protein
MKEKELILAKGEQPIAKISDGDLDFLISREFPNEKKVVKTKFKKIISGSQNGKNRISASILKLAEKDIDKIDLLVIKANDDFRDIVSEAEYPRASSYGFGERDDDENIDDYLKDWEEYSTWKEKK